MATFIVPVRNDSANLQRCLQSIQRSSTSASFPAVVVVDNGSTDDSAAAARRLGATVLELPGLKVADLRNHGAAVAQDDVLMFVDADHELAPGWIDAALDTLRQPAVGAVGAPYSAPERPAWVQRIYDGFRDHRAGIADVSWLGTGNMAVRAEAFAAVDGFDAGLEACEDVDFCQRLRMAGYRVLRDPRMRSIHYGDPASLSRLFVGELWRGRDNLRVSWRAPISLAGLPSIVIPLIDFGCLAGVVVGLLLRSSPAAAISSAMFFGLAMLRTGVLFSRLASRTAADVVRAFAVACTYDLARALALVARVPHRRAAQPLKEELS